MVSPARAAEVVSNEDMAARLMGVATFVEKACPGTSVNFTMLFNLMTALGVTVEQFQASPDRMDQSRALVEQFLSNSTAACIAAWGLFGDRGTTLPGLLKR